MDSTTVVYVCVYPYIYIYIHMDYSESQGPKIRDPTPPQTKNARPVKSPRDLIGGCHPSWFELLRAFESYNLPRPVHHILRIRKLRMNLSWTRRFQPPKSEESDGAKAPELHYAQPAKPAARGHAPARLLAPRRVPRGGAPGGRKKPPSQLPPAPAWIRLK